MISTAKVVSATVFTVTGTAAADNVNISALTLDGATVAGLSTTVTVTTTEKLIYSGQGGTGSTEAISFCRYLRNKTGLFIGGSSGAVVAACARYLAMHAEIERPICLSSDGGANYISSIFNEQWVAQSGLMVPHIPPLYLTGGLMGAVLVSVSLVTVRTLGAGGVVAATVSGQVVVSAILDRFGFLGLDRIGLTPARLLGFALLLAGTALVTAR